MPIRINLLAEQQAAEEMRRRDPVKRAYWVSGLLVGFVLVWTGLLQMQLSRAVSELATQNSKWKVLESKFKQVDIDFKRTTSIEARLESLDRLSTNRFLWGNVLHALQLTAVDGVEILKINGRQLFDFVDPIPSKTNSAGAGNTNKIITPGKLGSSRQKISITLQGKDVSPNPGSQINRYREVIAALPYFSNELRKVEGVALKNRSPVQSDPSDPTNRFFVDFTLECQFQDALRTNRTVIR